MITGTKVKIPILLAALVTVLAMGGIIVLPRALPAASGPPVPKTQYSLAELKKELWAADDPAYFLTVVDSFRSLPGPDAEAAGVLLDYLKENNHQDGWAISNALIDLMTDEQVAQLAREIALYNEVNAGSYLIPLLAARINDRESLSSAVISLQQLPGAGYYNYSRLLEPAWGKVFLQTDDGVRWLDHILASLNSPGSRENLILAVGGMARERLTGKDRLAVVDWLWRVQEKEPDPAIRCQQLLNLYQLGRADALEAVGRLYDSLPSARERTAIINEAGDIARWQLADHEKAAFIKWLWQMAQKDDMPFSRQECLCTLYQMGEQEALDSLVREIDQNGVATDADRAGVTSGSVGSWQLLKEVREKYPRSFLARGIRAYEEVRGEPYFELERREKYAGEWPVYFHGDEQYNPEKEIPGWEKFLTQFSSHPDADDAAYRLARCYEIEGRWTEALNTLQRALSLPDGDIRYDAAGRITYILDVRMTGEQLKGLSRQALSPSLRPLLDYTLAVREIRRDNYREAALALTEFLETYDDAETRDLPPLGPLYTGRAYDFRGAVQKQLSRMNELAGLKDQWEESRDPARLYALAASIYHDRTLYYNHLWAGQRQEYNWLGYINDTAFGRAPAEMAAFAREMINYTHSLGYFQQVYEDPAAPPELKAKALYSTGLSYIGLDQWGQEAWFAFSQSETRQQVIAVYLQFLREYPDSSLLDGALLALGTYTGEAGYLERIIRAYPEGEMAAKAQRLLEEMKSPYYSHDRRLYGAPVPFKILSAGDHIDGDINLPALRDLPEDVKKWALSGGRQPFAQSMTHGEWRYLLITPGEKPTAGYGVNIIDIYSNSQEHLTVRYRITEPKAHQPAARLATHPYILARLVAGGPDVEFTEENW